MSTNTMAILQDVDKCMRCNGCVISCKRTWKMKALQPGVHKTAADQRVIIKSQKRVDMGPFMRYSCWHCSNPPCVKRCPFDAMAKQPSGAVTIDYEVCQPGGTKDGVLCTRQCQVDCGRGGYPKIGAGSDLYTGSKANKCTLCFGRAGADADINTGLYGVGSGLPTKVTPVDSSDDEADWVFNSPISGTSVPELKHQPSCVYTCPARAMHWDTMANIRTYMGTQGYISAQGDGSMFWASRKYLLIAPKADPFVEDHVTPLMSSLVSGPFAKAALVPTLLAGGLVAVIARRQRLADQSVGEV